MLRFCGENQISQSEGLDIEIAEQCLIFDEKVWQNGKDYFKYNGFHDITKLQLIPICNSEGELLCYGWQDGEANRELRMLKELGENQNALQFKDVFPKIKEVVIFGCNELAYCFARYLSMLKISVLVSGKYWEYLGYKSVNDADFDDSDKMIIYAERLLENKGGIFQRVIRSVSPEFECINKIYEANILAGNIKDISGGLEWLIDKVNGKDVVILGINERAQDTYDLLLSHGIDIKCFVVERLQEESFKLLLGKSIKTIPEVLRSDGNLAIIEIYNKNSSWGSKYIELFDYYGYRRNESFFLISEYTDIPCSNLIHILRGKSVFLTGDERLCKILAEYLEDVEQGDIKLQYAKKLQKEMVTKKDIICTVYLWYGSNASERKAHILGAYLTTVPHTDYFSRAGVFTVIERYKTKYTEKYHLKQLIPKGILLNITFSHSGNVFFKGIMDGHPNILQLQYDVFSNNLFSYCIRLSNEKAANILSVFQLILKMEMSEDEFQWVFPFWNKFERSMEQWLSLQERFTSQELFVIFHAAYTEMMCGEKIADVSQKVIYFDPHWIGQRERPVLAEWLESELLNEQIVTIRRNHIAWLCSQSSFEKNILKVEEINLAYNIVTCMIQDNIDVGTDNVTFQHCGKFEVRFEDLKLHPKTEFLKICERMEIPWSDSMLYTTVWGKRSSMGAIRDFNLKPVFNKHETDWSEFDRFRICLISSPYQKKYGYSYEECTKFSRTELWEMFLKEFQFQQGLPFDSAEDKSAYYLLAYESIRWKLWKNRKHTVMDDVKPIFKPIEIGQTEKELMQEKQQIVKKERERLAELVGCKERMALYGLGKDGEALWDCLNESVRSRLVLCDKKADNESYYFYGKEVVKPEELCTKYKDYEIVVTSSRFYREINAELIGMGVDVDRITCNTIQLWEEEG